MTSKKYMQLFAQSGHMRSSLIKALCLSQVFPHFTGDPHNHVTNGHSHKARTHTGVTVNVVGHLPVASNWPRIGGQKRCQNTCTDCRAVFKDKLQLIAHVKREHGRNRFSCPRCECTFVSKGGLNAHIQYNHQKVASYRCETCGKGYANRTYFVDHLTTHTGVKRNVCPVCQQQYTSKCSLKTHMLRCHPSESGQVISKQMVQ